MATKVYFEQNGVATLIATFEDANVYAAIAPYLEDIATYYDAVLTESEVDD